MRLDLLTGDWVSIAAARQNRAFLPPAEFDPLAPQSDTNPSEVPSQYDVAVFENRSPSFGPALGDAENAPEGLEDLRRLGVGRTRTSVGRTEVVCFDPRHARVVRRPVARTRARTVVEAWAQRTAALSALDGVQQVFPFENRGEAIGVTLHHPHGQIYAYPYVTPRTQRLLDSSRRVRRGPVRRPARVRAGGRARRARERVVHRLRAVRGALAGRAAPAPEPPRRRPHRADRRGEGRARRRLPPARAGRRRALRHPDAVHRRVAPGARSAPTATGCA